MAGGEAARQGRHGIKQRGHAQRSGQLVNLPQRVGSGCNASKSSRPIMLSEQPPLMRGCRSPAAPRRRQQLPWALVGRQAPKSPARPSSKRPSTWHGRACVAPARFVPFWIGVAFGSRANSRELAVASSACGARVAYPRAVRQGAARDSTVTTHVRPSLRPLISPITGILSIHGSPST